MTKKQLPITEHQQGVDPWSGHYRYIRFDAVSGLHVFKEGDANEELFAKRRTAPAGWYLRRGSYCYEFVRSV